MFQFENPLFTLGPNADFAIFFDVNADDVGVAADWAVFDVALVAALRKIDWHDDFLAATVANVTGVVLHESNVSSKFDFQVVDEATSPFAFAMKRTRSLVHRCPFDSQCVAEYRKTTSPVAFRIYCSQSIFIERIFLSARPSLLSVRTRIRAVPFGSGGLNV